MIRLGRHTVSSQKRSPPHVNELNEFEDCMQNAVIQRIEFRTDHQSNNLQRKLANDLKEIRQDKNIFVKADKTTDHYKSEPKEYMTLVHKNVTKGYKKADWNVPDAITSVDKKVAEKLGLDDRIEVSANRDPFLTMKDHKPDFMNNPTCRLINPSKSEIGIISKQILDNKEKSDPCNTSEPMEKYIKRNTVVSSHPEKNKHAFITFDVCDFYPSISEQLLMKALDYASQFITISQQDRHIITHAKKSLLYP